jgi:hypothetical protein
MDDPRLTNRRGCARQWSSFRLCFVCEAMGHGETVRRAVRFAAQRAPWRSGSEIIDPTPEIHPEGTIQRREMRSPTSMREDRELLAQRELDDGLVLAAPEQSEDAPKNRDRESRYGPHRSRILREFRPRKEA